MTVWSCAVAGKAQVSWMPCICAPAREPSERGRGMGHVTMICNACHQERRRSRFYEPAHDHGQQPLTAWSTRSGALPRCAQGQLLAASVGQLLDQPPSKSLSNEHHVSSLPATCSLAGIPQFTAAIRRIILTFARSLAI
jgi:hypothetical protein